MAAVDEPSAWYSYYYSLVEMKIVEFLEHDLVVSVLETIDWPYLRWLMYVLYPVIVSFILPFVLVIFLYISSLSLYLIRHRRDIHGLLTPNLMIGAKRVLAWVYSGHGRIWHGYEVIGMEHIPPGPALIIYYHGVIPVDIYYFMAQVFLEKQRHLHSVGDRFLFKIPGLGLLMEVACVVPGSVQEGVNLMKDGQLMTIAPGGVREGLFADGYELIWGKRVGFAKIALQAQVPIIPVFTQNCKEAFRTVGFCRTLLRKAYEKTRLPIVPVYGGLPVKLRTFVGAPIAHDPSLSPEQLSERVQNAIKNLIQKHQTQPGSMLQALLDRFRTLSKPEPEPKPDRIVEPEPESVIEPSAMTLEPEVKQSNSDALEPKMKRSNSDADSDSKSDTSETKLVSNCETDKTLELDSEPNCQRQCEQNASTRLVPSSNAKSGPTGEPEQELSAKMKPEPIHCAGKSDETDPIEDSHREI